MPCSHWKHLPWRETKNPVDRTCARLLFTAARNPQAQQLQMANIEPDLFLKSQCDFYTCNAQNDWGQEQPCGP